MQLVLWRSVFKGSGSPLDWLLRFEYQSGGRLEFLLRPETTLFEQCANSPRFSSHLRGPRCTLRSSKDDKVVAARARDDGTALSLNALQGGDDGAREIIGAALAALVGCERAPLRVYFADRPVEPRRLAFQAEILEHHRRREHRGRRIDNAFAHDIRRGAVHRFEVGVVVAVASAGRDAEAADRPRGAIRKDVAVEVRCHHHVELVRRSHNATREIVNDELFVNYFRMRRDRFLGDLAEEAIRFVQHVVLRSDGDFAFAARAFAFQCKLTGELDYAARRDLRYDLDRVDAAARSIERAAQNSAPQL